MLGIATCEWCQLGVKHRHAGKDGMAVLRLADIDFMEDFRSEAEQRGPLCFKDRDGVWRQLESSSE